MAMNRDRAVELGEGNEFGVAVELICDELFEEAASWGDGIGAWQAQFTIILSEHGIAGGLEEEDGDLLREPGRDEI